MEERKTRSEEEEDEEAPAEIFPAALGKVHMGMDFPDRNQSRGKV